MEGSVGLRTRFDEGSSISVPMRCISTRTTNDISHMILIFQTLLSGRRVIELGILELSASFICEVWGQIALLGHDLELTK